MEELLTVEEVASYLRVSRSTVWRWCQEKKVPAFKIGREWRISRPVLEDLVAAHQPQIVHPEPTTGPPEEIPEG
jgi:excisionase family DNA binding protein